MELFEKAARFALEAHHGQYRKNGRLPYIVHPMEVASIAGSLCDREEVLAAALLHDTVEDAGATLSQIRAEFGDRVAALVLSETENKHAERPATETWKARKTESLALLRETDDVDVKILWLSDKLSNVRSFYRQFVVEGSAMWEHYHEKDPAVQAWYYRAIAAYTAELSDSFAHKEYVGLLDVIFGKEEN